MLDSQLFGTLHGARKALFGTVLNARIAMFGTTVYTGTETIQTAA
jgi:hypothetical protein